MTQVDTTERLKVIVETTGVSESEAKLLGLDKTLNTVAHNRSVNVVVDDKGSHENVITKNKALQKELTKTTTVTEKLKSGFSQLAAEGSKVGGSFLNLIKVPAMFAGIAIAIAGIPGLITVALGSIVAMGVGFAGIGAIAGTAMIGLNGITNAVTAGRTQALSSITTNEQYAKSLREVDAAALGVVKAQQDAIRAQSDLANAETKYAQAPRDAAQAITQARLTAAQATQAETDAVVGLQEAQKNLIQLQRSIAMQSVVVTQETDAFTGKIVERTTKAVNALNQVDINSATNAVTNAQLAITQAKLSNMTAQEALTNSEAKGVYGSDIYLGALYGLQTAQNQVAGSTNAIADAQQNLVSAQRTSTSPMNAYALAMSKLGPTAQGFVEYVNASFIPAIISIRDATQNGLLPGVQNGLDVVVAHTQGLSTAFGSVGKAVGDSFSQFMQYWGAPQNASVLSAMIDGLAGPNGVIASLTKGLLPLGSVLAQVLVAATPLFNTLMTDFGNWLDGIDKVLKTGGAGKLQDWFSSLAGPITNTFGLLGDLGAALTPLVTTNGAFDKLVTGLRENFVPAFSNLITDISNSNLGEGMVSVLVTLTNVIDAIVNLNNATNNGLLIGILSLMAGSSLVTGIAGIVGSIKAVASLGGIVARFLAPAAIGTAATGTVATAASETAIAAVASRSLPAIIGTVAKGVLKGGIIGAIVNVVSGAAADGIDSVNPSGKNGNGNRVGANALRGAGIGFGIGATVGSVIPGLGTAVGGAIGAGVGGAVGVLTSDPKDIDNLNKTVNKWLTDSVFKPVGDFFSGAGKDIGIAWDVVVSTVSSSFSQMITNVENLFNQVGNNIGTAWNSVATGVGNFFSNVGTGIGTAWNVAGSVVSQGWNNITKMVGDAWNGITSGVSTAWNNVTNAIHDGWNSAIRGIKNVVNGIIDGLNSIPVLGLRISRLAADGATVSPLTAASGATVPGRGTYRDKVPYLLAPGEEVISNRNGQADRNRALLKSISNNSYSGGGSGTAMSQALMDALAKPRVAMQVKVEDMTSASQIATDLAFRLR